MLSAKGVVETLGDKKMLGMSTNCRAQKGCSNEINTVRVNIVQIHLSRGLDTSNIKRCSNRESRGKEEGCFV